MLAALALGFGEALSPMQILWINLVSDILPGLGLGLEPADARALARGPSDHAPIVGRREAARLGGEAALMSAGALGACAYGAFRYGAGSPRTRTMTFASLVGAQLLHGLTCRSRRRGLFTRERAPANPALAGALGVSAALQAAAFCIPPLRSVMGLSRLGLADLGVTAAAGVLPYLTLETLKTRTPARGGGTALSASAPAPAE
jgi:Ca2+-transporting ATPase